MKAILIDLDGTKTTIEVPENAPGTWYTQITNKSDPKYGNKSYMRPYKLEWIYPASTEEKKWAVYKEIDSDKKIPIETTIQLESKKSLYGSVAVAKITLEKMMPAYQTNSIPHDQLESYIPVSEPLETSKPVETPKLPPIAEKNRRRMKLRG